MARWNQQTTKRGTGSQSRFANIAQANIPRSVFDRSMTLKTSFNAGNLVPIWVDEALPGDTFKMNANLFGRLSTPLHALMDNLILDAFFFAVPYRLLQDNWEKLMGAQDNPGDSVDFLAPTMTSPAGGYLTHSLSDYLGIPVGEAGLVHSSYWHRAYNLIYKEWFRDENLIDSPVVDTDDGPDDPADYVIRKRGKRKDYFSSCLPWPQKGDAIDLPLGLTAPLTVTGDGKPEFTVGAADPMILEAGSASSATTSILGRRLGGSGPAVGDDYVWADPKLQADLSSATGATINELRTAFQMQKLMERDARGGTRYVEILQSHFQVSSPDFRLQRPELLGQFSAPLNMAVVPNTALITAALGDVGGFGTFAHQARGWMKSFTEHCVLLGLIAMRAPLTYQQGLHRRFSRGVTGGKWDFYFPALAHLGEQAVLNKEIFVDVVGGTDEQVFGYQERFAEYRYGQNIVTGQMRSSSTFGTPLDTWHLGLDFASLPALNETFIEDNPPVDRVVALTAGTDDTPHVIFDAIFDLKCVRPLPTYGVPGLIDHF